MRCVIYAMGMPISIELDDVDNCAEIINTAKAILDDVDKRFSIFKPDSEVSKYSIGKIERDNVSKELNHIIKDCEVYKKLTKGYFTANFRGAFDPTGYVKGWAINKLAGYIKSRSCRTFFINAGGDIYTSSYGSRVWGIGLQDPMDKNKLLGAIKAKNIAVATSGTYEKGPHIINPKSGQPAIGYVSATVLGPKIIVADVLATTLMAMGKPGIKFIADSWTEYQACLIDGEYNIFTTDGFAGQRSK